MNASVYTDCVNQRVNRVNHSKRCLLQVKSTAENPCHALGLRLLQSRNHVITVVSLHKTLHDDTVNDSVNDTVNDTAKLILQSIVENPHITYQGIVEKIAIARATVARYMSKLKELGYILRHDSDKNGYWEVIKKS